MNSMPIAFVLALLCLASPVRAQISIKIGVLNESLLNPQGHSVLP